MLKGAAVPEFYKFAELVIKKIPRAIEIEEMKPVILKTGFYI